MNYVNAPNSGATNIHRPQQSYENLRRRSNSRNLDDEETTPSQEHELGLPNYTNLNDRDRERVSISTNNPMYQNADAEFIELDEGTFTEDNCVDKNYPADTIVSPSCKNPYEPPPDQGDKIPKRKRMLYEIDDIPSWYLTIFLGFQHYLLMAGATLSLPLVLMPKMCMSPEDKDQGHIISTYLFSSGIATILQTTFGTRLPIVQGGSFAFIIPALAVLETNFGPCPAPSTDPLVNTEEWQKRMRVIQGAIICSSFFQIALGLSGIFGFIMKRITPITLASSVIVIGLSLFEVASFLSSTNWFISSLTILLAIIFSQYLRFVKISIPFTKSPKPKGGRLRYPLFQIFPVLLTLLSVWSLCGILTVTNYYKEGNPSRTDAKILIIQQSSWFRVPYPFQWGWPVFTASATIGFLSAVFAGIVESIGEYNACARIVGASSLKMHTINRGIFMEGIGCFIVGIFGTGNGTTSYSENTGAISITRVGSRRVVQTAGFIMMVFSLIGTLGAIFISIPDPVIGGILTVTFSVIIGVGLSNLHMVDLTSSRNIFVIGFSVFFAMSISKWVNANKGLIDVGNDEINKTIQILLTTGMFVAGVTSFILDNTIPGTKLERGLIPLPRSKNETGELAGDEELDTTYDLPFGMKYIRSRQWTSWIPILPTFDSTNFTQGSVWARFRRGSNPQS